MPAWSQFIVRDVDVVSAAALLAEPTRAAMLTALLDDRPLAAGELARLAGVSPATASAHLARLLSGGLVTMTRQGRHRYFRLAGPEVAAAMEALAQLGTTAPVRSLRESRDAEALARARTCYDHLAGRAGVGLLEALLARGMLVPTPGSGRMANSDMTRSTPARPNGTAPADGERPGPRAALQSRIRGAGFRVTAAGSATLTAFGLNMDVLQRSRRQFAGACLDRTEGKPHLNGALGAAVTARLLALGWIEMGSRRRAVRVTPAGHDGLTATFGCALED
jgi:DNA-binding transcriptional ArsR family regulator